MEHKAQQSTPDDDDPIAFTPVPMLRRRANGWTPERQQRFIYALQVMGAVGPAARAVGMGRASAYRLRDRAGAESFAEAWDIAFETGQDRQFHAAIDLAINGVTTIRVLRGGMVDVTTGPSRKLLHAALLPPPPRVSRPVPAPKATRETR